MDWLRRAGRRDDSRAIAQEAIQAEEARRWLDAERLYRRALAAAGSESDEFNLAYLEGRLANALVQQERNSEAKDILEHSLGRPSDVRIPASVSMLVDIYLGERDWQRAETVLRDGIDAQTRREERAGRSRPDPTGSVLTLSGAGVKYADPEPIARAERWASDLGNRELWFAASHRRGQLTEESGDVEGAVAHYRWLADEGSAHEPTHTRLLILLERTGERAEALERATALLGRRWSASFEEQTRKRIQRLQGRLAPRGQKPAKQVIPAFSVREGADMLEWVGQVEVKGGVAAVGRWQDALLVRSGGKDSALFAVPTTLAAPEHLRAMERGSFVVTSPAHDRAVLVTNEGRVADGRATVAGLDTQWRMADTVHLGGVTSEVAAVEWGVGAGSRDGGLYACDWNGRLLWTYRVPSEGDGEAYSRRCPYYVDGAAEVGRIVFSSWSEVMCLEPDGRVAWLWTIPTETREWHTVYSTAASEVELANAARVLGIPPDATEPDIRAAFRRRAKETHPDTSGRPPSDFVAVRDSYETMLGGAVGQEPLIGFTMTMSIATLVTSVRATTDGGAWVAGSNGSAFRLDAQGRIVRTQPGSDQSAWLLTDESDRLAAVSDWDGITVFDASGHPVGGHPTGQRLELGLSPDEQIISGYSKKDLFLFSRRGALLSHVEFSRPIADMRWVGDEIYVGAGKLIAMSAGRIPRALAT